MPEDKNADIVLTLDDPNKVIHAIRQLFPIPDPMRQKPKIVVLCGSSRFVQYMAVCAWIIERDEKAIALGLHLLPAWYPNIPDHHLAEHEGCAAEMDELHLRKVDLAKDKGPAHPQSQQCIATRRPAVLHAFPW